MPDYTIQEISNAIDASIIGKSPSQYHIRHLLIDSRQVTDGRSTLFFALKTGRNDGHKYINQLIADGVRTFVVSHIDKSFQNDERLVFLLTDNPLSALQKLAAYHRNKFSVPIIGITGSNGKTIVKEWLSQLLLTKETVCASPKSFNSQIGVPLSVWQLNEEHTIGIFEAGISQPGEMANLERIIKPTIGLITNIGQAHSANFIDLKQKITEKLSLFSNAEVIVCCSDHVEITDCIKDSNIFSGIRLFTWGCSPMSDLIIIRKQNIGAHTQIDYRLKKEHDDSDDNIHHFRIPFTDEASIENCLHGLAIMRVLGYNDITDQTFIHLQAVEMRLQLREGINNCSLINDSYSNDLNSLTVALEFLNQQKQHEKKTIILSDILQSDREESQLYTDISLLLKARDIRRLIGIGRAIGKYRFLFDGQCDYFNSTDDFLRWIASGSFADETILIKGARSFGFERIVTRLEQKNHETLLETNLSAIIHNLNFFRSLLKPEVKITAMVKAFSYGSGSFEIANALQFHHIDYLAVAYADEGFELRKAGITTPIMVMNPERIGAGTLIRYQLEPEIYSIQQLIDIGTTIPEGISDECLKIHLKLETGMHRLGIEETDGDNLLSILKTQHPKIRVASIFSHLAGSDEPDLDSFTNNQIGLFTKFSNKIQSELGYPVLRHILNSSGIIRFPEAQFDMVRLGIGLYGISPLSEVQNNLQNVNTLKSHISQIKMVSQGESVGYNRRYMAGMLTRIAIAPIGYADGLSRNLGYGKYRVTIRGKKAPIIGSISMDMCTLDITEIPEARVGDVVTIFKDADDIAEMASTLYTIPYEILTGISRRVKRVYFEE